MRNYALRMTLLVATVAVVILGIPAMVFGSIILWHTGNETGTAHELIVRDIAFYLTGGLIGIASVFLLAIASVHFFVGKMADSLVFLAAAAEQLGGGRTRPQLKESGFEEIDLVYDELRRSADRIAGRISAERQFSADASHQLRTPLTALSMRLEEIAYLSTDSAVKEEANYALEQVERLVEVVEELLAQSRSAAGGANEVVSLAPIFEQQHSEWEKSFTKAGRTLVFTDEANVPVLATPSSIAQILATLIENSLKYGEGTTTVTTQRVSGGVVVSVTDEGKGVPQELVETIFHKGVSTGGSTGYGLPIARQLADVDGGRLELTQAQPPVFSLTLGAVPASLAPEKVLPAGSLMAMGARRRRR